MVLYADVLFLIDFSMDVLTLWTAGKLTHSELKVWRVALSAAFGALVSVIATALGASRAAGAVISAVSAFVMTFIAFGYGKPTLIIRRYIFLWLGGILLGGVMTVLMSVGRLQANSDSTNADLAVIPMGVLLLFVLVSAIIRTPKVDRTYITLGFRDRSCELRAICDSGNLLSDPFSGESVILIKKEAAAVLFSDSELTYLMSQNGIPPESIFTRVRLIPASSLSGETLIKAVRVDKVTVGGKSCAALVAVTDNIKSENYNAVVSTKLL